MTKHPIPSLVVMSAVMVLAGSPVGPSPSSRADSPSTTLYFLRHGETQRRLVGTGTGTFAEVCTPTRSCCETPLNPLGITRRDALAEWFVDHGIAKRLTHLIATNKPRTVQTLTALAIASGLGGDQNGELSSSERDTEDFRFVPQDQRDYAADRGPGANDTRHRLAANATIDLPLALRATGVVTARSALPYNITTGGGDNGDRVTTTDRPADVGRNSERGDPF